MSPSGRRAGPAAILSCLTLLLAGADPAGALTFREYAERCEFELGKIPEFDCTSGTPLRASRRNEGKTCPQLPDPDCVSGSRIGNLNTGPDTTTVFLCRKYRPVRDPIFHDIAIIQHNRRNGKTCWFQTKTDKRVNGRRVPTPTTLRGRTFWVDLTRRASARVTACPACHSASPYILTPYLEPAVGSSPSKWNPDGAYDPNFQGIFEVGEYDSHRKFDLKSGGCSHCHGFGKDNLGLVELTRKFTSMPPGITLDEREWEAAYDDDLALIKRCSNPATAESNPNCDLYSPLRFCNRKRNRVWVYVFALEPGGGSRSVIYGAWRVAPNACEEIGTFRGKQIMVHAMDANKRSMMPTSHLRLCIGYAHHGYRRVKLAGHTCSDREHSAAFVRVKKSFRKYTYTLR